MPNGNPFTIDIGPGFGGQLQGLGQAIGGAAQTIQRQQVLNLQQQKLQDKRALEAYVRQQALQAQSEFVQAMETGNPDQMQAVSVKWADVAPGATKLMFGAAQAKTKEEAALSDDVISSGIGSASVAKTSTEAVEALERNRDRLTKMGMTTAATRMDTLIDDINEDPENFKRITEMGLAAYAPDRYQNLKDRRANRLAYEEIASKERQSIEAIKAKERKESEKIRRERRLEFGKASTNIANLDKTVAEAEALINDEDFAGAVGPIDRWTASLGAKFFESKQGILNKRADRMIARLVQQAAESLKGALSDKDLAFLERSQPTVSDSPEVWKDWLENDYKPMIERSKAEMYAEAGLSKDDAEALKWAEKNPDDERAKQIKRKLGF